MPLLILRGIPKTDRSCAVVEERKYTTIPDYFTTKEEWPTKCNLNCYTCTAQIGGIPLFIPALVEPDKISKLDTTVYCSPSCAVSRIFTLNNPDLYIKYLRALIHRITGKVIISIDRSEDKSSINIYGGNQTSHNYQAKIHDINAEWFNLS